MDFLPDLSFATDFEKERKLVSISEETKFYADMVLPGLLWHLNPAQAATRSHSLGMQNHE